MKNKKIILLAMLVAVIWGTIGYQVFLNLTTNQERTYVQTKVQPDSTREMHYTLTLNYADPFFKRKPLIVQKPVNVPIKKSPRPLPPPAEVDWSVIAYKGMLYNATQKVPTAIVSILGAEYFVKEGSTIFEYRITDVKHDSLAVSFKNQATYIKRSVTH